MPTGIRGCLRTDHLEDGPMHCRLLLASLALSGLAVSASAQQIDVVINSGSSWVLNSSWSETGEVLAIYHPPPGYPCQVGSDVQSARVEYDIRLTLGFNSPAAVYASYGGGNHAGCVLNPVSASASKAGYADFVRTSGTGAFDYRMRSHAVANTTYAHADGQASADFTVTLYSPAVTTPPVVKPPFQLQLSNSASVTGTNAAVVTNFTDTGAQTKTNRDYFSVTVAVNGSSSVSLPSALIQNPGVGASVAALPHGSDSYVRLKD
jgi:hypothetical protein